MGEGTEKIEGRRVDVPLTGRFFLTLIVPPDMRTCAIQLRLFVGRKQVCATPLYALDERTTDRLRLGKPGYALTADDRVAGDFMIVYEERLVVVHWAGIELSALKHLVTEPLTPVAVGDGPPLDPSREVDWRRSGWDSILEDERVFLVDGKRWLHVERRGGRCHLRWAGDGIDRYEGEPHELTDNCSLERVDRYQWLTTGGTGVWWQGNDSLRVHAFGNKFMGYVGFESLREAILAMGGRLVDWSERPKRSRGPRSKKEADEAQWCE